jgi:hypothetical protein
MARRTVLSTTLLTVLLMSTSGCLRLVGINNRQIAPLNVRSMPMAITPSGDREIKVVIAVSGATQTFDYNSILWRFARLPCIRSQPGFLVMLDTGMDAPGHITLDVVAAQKYPAHLGAPVDFAYLPSLNLGDVTFSNLLVLIETNRYEAQFLGLPLYRANGAVLGMASLGQTRYLAFDNDRREVTIGLEPFVPRADHVWESFPFAADLSGGLFPRPYVDLPVAGTPVRLLADSAGGPRLILNRDHWTKIESRVKVTHHRQNRYPTWGGFQEVDSYEVAELEIGPLKLKNTIVWVRRGQMREVAPSIGLGVLGKATAVWDFAGQRLWIGREAGH